MQHLELEHPLNEEFASAGEASNDREKAELMLAVDMYDELVSSIPAAQKRVLATSMTYRADGTTDVIVRAMADKAEEDDVRVALQADAVTYMTAPGNTPIWWPLARDRHEQPERLDNIQSRADMITSAGGEFRWLNGDSKLKAIAPILNIAHTKCVIVDDTVYFSGPNLNENNLLSTPDIVVRVDDQALADQLEDMLFTDERPLQNDYINVEGVGEIIFDDGRSRQSQINKLARTLISSAQEEVLMLGKFGPGRKLADSLRQAVTNGANVDYVCHNSHMNKPQKLNQMVFGKKDTSFVREQTDDSIELFGLSHSTLLVVDDTAVITTSVFSEAAEFSHMEEIALFTHEPSIVAQARELFHTICPKERVLEEVDWDTIYPATAEIEDSYQEPAGKIAQILGRIRQAIRA